MAKVIIDYNEIIKHQATENVGTLGHVSEGKSTLVRAITGVKTQRHAKEQERNITINLGYANAKIFHNPKTDTYVSAPASKIDMFDKDGTPMKLVKHISFVDCPGHEAYMATMIGGTAVMDSACLVIATNQDVIPQPQTQEHLIAATKVELTKMIVLQNKCDLVTESKVTTVYEKIKEFVKDTVAEGVPIFPISAQREWNIDAVVRYLANVAPTVRDYVSPFQMTIIRSFDVNKPGLIMDDSIQGGVIGGTVQQGVVFPGDFIEIRPGHYSRDSAGNIQVRPLFVAIDSLRSETTTLPYAVSGGLIGIGTKLDPALTRGNRLVGHIAGIPGTLPPITARLTARFSAFRRPGVSSYKPRVGDVVRVSVAVFTTPGKIIATEGKTITIEFERPACVRMGQMLGILHKNTELGKEILDGVATVKSIEEYEYVLKHIGDLPEIIPKEIELRGFPDACVQKIPEYRELLGKLPLVSSISTERFRVREPVTSAIPKHTIVVNYNEILESFGAREPKTILPMVSYREHFYAYINAELCTTSSVNGEGQLIIAGKFTRNDITKLVAKYIKKYKQCKQCHTFDTCLVRDGRVIKTYCGACLSTTWLD